MLPTKALEVLADKQLLADLDNLLANRKRGQPAMTLQVATAFVDRLKYTSGRYAVYATYKAAERKVASLDATSKNLRMAWAADKTAQALCEAQKIELHDAHGPLLETLELQHARLENIR